MKNYLFICFLLILTGCKDDDTLGERTHDLVIGNETITVSPLGDTVNVNTRYSFIITSIKLEVNHTISSVLQYVRATPDSVYYVVEQEGKLVEINLRAQDTLKYQGISIWRKEGGLSAVVEKNPLSLPRKYTIALDDISNYGYIYIVQPVGMTSSNVYFQ